MTVSDSARKIPGKKVKDYERDHTGRAGVIDVASALTGDGESGKMDARAAGDVAMGVSGAGAMPAPAVNGVPVLRVDPLRRRHDDVHPAHAPPVAARRLRLGGGRTARVGDRGDPRPLARAAAGLTSTLDWRPEPGVAAPSQARPVRTSGCASRLRAQATLLQPLLDGRCRGLLRLTLDVLGLLAAVLVTIYWPGETIAWDAAWLLVLYPLPVMVLLWLRGMYDRRLRPTVLEDAAPVLGSISIATMLLGVLEVYVAPDQLPPGVLVHIWALSIVGVGGPRIALVGAQRLACSRGLLRRPTLIVGAGEVGLKVARRLQADPGYGLWPVGFLDAYPAPENAAMVDDIPVLGHPADLEAIAGAIGAQHVVLAFSATPDAELVELVQRCGTLGLQVTVVPRLYESVNARFRYEAMGGLPLLSLRQTRPRGIGFLVKHAFDRVAALAIMLAIAPLLLMLAVGVRCSSPGPVVFRQRRVGRDGKTFDLLKFRSMALAPADAANVGAAAGHAPGGVQGVDRRTRIGRLMRRTSLDELPQLLNVLRGDMSLVGPRPERPEFVEVFGTQVGRYDDRHRVKSGITGWAQVHGLRGQTSLAHRVEWDNYYIEHWSLGLDLRIMALTAFAVFRSAE